jgi:tRNA(Arg) A34 adenosine deaminase TadA
MLPRLSQRTYDLMRRAIDAVDKDTADLITTLVASAFVDGGKEMLARKHEADTERELEDA